MKIADLIPEKEIPASALPWRHLQDYDDDDWLQTDEMSDEELLHAAACMEEAQTRQHTETHVDSSAAQEVPRTKQEVKEVAHEDEDEEVADEDLLLAAEEAESSLLLD